MNADRKNRISDKFLFRCLKGGGAAIRRAVNKPCKCAESFPVGAAPTRTRPDRRQKNGENFPRPFPPPQRDSP